MIKILHISDYHYNKKFSAEFSAITQSICKIVDKENIDCIVFSGDLVYEGSQEETFSEAYNLLISPILESTRLTKERVLIVPGNHDVDRNAEMPMVTKFLEECHDLETLTSFIDDKRQLESSFVRMKPYLSFINEIFPETQYSKNQFYFISRFVTRGVKVGLLGINSSWRSFDSQKDRANLLLPKKALIEALDKLADMDIIISAMHHNISDFKDYVMQDIEDIIYDNCHILLTGHYHKAHASMHVASEIGLFQYSAPATLNINDNKSSYGFAIVSIDDTYNVRVCPYIMDGSVFIPGREFTQELPMSDDKREANRFRKTMRKHYSTNLKKADNLFVTGHDTSEDSGYSFTKLFSNPIIKDKSIQEIISTKNEGHVYSVQQILESSDNYIVYGLDKSGKTSLLWKILIDGLKDYDRLHVIPILISCDDYKSGNKFHLKSFLTTYLQASKRKVEELLKSYTILILLDDFDYKDYAFIEMIVPEFKQVPTIRVIATSDETMHSLFESRDMGDITLTKLYIHAITEKEVHSLTVKWPNITKERKRQFEERIMQIFEQMHIPLNYWTASLFLWILERTDESNIHNNFELIKLYVDELLHRNSIVKYNEMNIQYDDLLSYLGNLAEFLLEHYNDIYSVTYQELVDFTNDYIHKNKKYTETDRNTIDILLRYGVIYETTNNRYTFRLKGVFEYFVAYQMSRKAQFLDKIKAEKNFYLSYGNEFELYAGFRKEDFSFVKFIYSQTQDIFKPESSKENYYNIDKRLQDDVSALARLRETTKKLMSKIHDMPSSDDDYVLMSPSQPLDTSKVEQKKYYEKIAPVSVNLEKALFILARVYRNSNICNYTEDDSADDILNFILTGSCNLGLLFLKTFEKNDSTGNESAQDLMKIILQFMPIVVQTFLYDAIAQNNLSRIFKEKLQELKQNPEDNQFRIFLLTMILVDLDIDNNIDLLADMENYLDKGALIYASYCKQIILAFKYSDNAPLKNRLLQSIDKLSKRIERGGKSKDSLMKELSMYNSRKLSERDMRARDYQ